MNASLVPFTMMRSGKTLATSLQGEKAKSVIINLYFIYSSGGGTYLALKRLVACVSSVMGHQFLPGKENLRARLALMISLHLMATFPMVNQG